MHVLRYGMAHFRHSATIFGTVSFFSKKVQKFMAGPPARIIITPADILLRVRIIITPADIVLQCEKIGYSSVMY